MVVGLGDGVAVPQGGQALGIGVQDLGVGFRRLLPQPTDEGRAEIKAEMPVDC